MGDFEKAPDPYDGYHQPRYKVKLLGFCFFTYGLPSGKNTLDVAGEAATIEDTGMDTSFP